MPRFSEAISEGDGISIIPVLAGDIARLAAAAEDAGAEAVAVASLADAARVRDGTDLPVVVRAENVEAASGAGADACILAFDASGEEPGWIDEQYALARDLGLDCAVDVRTEEALERALERVDPDIILISKRRRTWSGRSTSCPTSRRGSS
jgi:indole-3-glycerol phosphate synthase